MILCLIELMNLKRNDEEEYTYVSLYREHSGLSTSRREFV